MRSSVGILGGLLIAISPLAAKAAADGTGFVSLFDGPSLAGWKVWHLPKDKELAATAWKVDGGTILANTIGSPKHFYIMLAAENEYGDFVLRMQIQTERGVTGNSGIQIRSRYNAETGWMEGLQIDINPPNPDCTGKLWNEGPGPHRGLSNEPVKATFYYADEGPGWNDMEITAQGTRIKSVLNGTTVVDYDGAGVLDDELHRQAKHPGGCPTTSAYSSTSHPAQPGCPSSGHPMTFESLLLIACGGRLGII